MHPGRSLVLACALVSTTAHADDKADKAEADKHYQLGKRHYNLNEWDEAIGEFKAAYKLFPDPVNLYNIAQAYRLKGKNCTNAAQFYANYQREEKTKKLRDSVTKVRKDMEDCAKTEKSDEPLPVPPPVPAPDGEPPLGPAPLAPQTAPTGEDAMRHSEPSAADLDPNRNRRIFGYVLLGTGGALLVGGLLYSGKIADLENTLEGCDNVACDSGDNPKVLEDERARAKINANACYGLGVSAVIGGGLLYWLSRKPKQDNRVTVMPMRGGAAVHVRF